MSKSNNIKLYLDETTWEYITTLASKYNISPSKVIRIILKNYKENQDE